MLENGGLALAMALPKDLGGTGEGHNPEQLFALGWSACFGQAILALAKKHGLDGQARQGHLRGHADNDEQLLLQAELKVSLPGADKAKLQALIEDAHTICPYSRPRATTCPSR